MTRTLTVSDLETKIEAAPSSPSPMRDQIIAFVTGALFIGAGLVIAFGMFIGPNMPKLDPTAAWCRGWVDGLSYTDLRSGNQYDEATLDKAEARCQARVEAGQRAPGARGPLEADS